MSTWSGVILVHALTEATGEDTTTALDRLTAPRRAPAPARCATRRWVYVSSEGGPVTRIPRLPDPHSVFSDDLRPMFFADVADPFVPDHPL